MHLQISLITASGCNFLFAGLCPPRVFPNSFSYGLQVRTIMVSEFMSEITLSRPQSAWTHSLHYRLQVHTYMAPKCISNYVQSRLRTASPSSLDHDLLNLLLTKAVSLSWTFRHTSQGLSRELLRKRSSGSMNVERGWEEIKEYPAIKNHSNCVDQWKLGHSLSDEELGNIWWGFRIRQLCRYTPGFPKYILPVADSVSVIPVSPYSCI